MSQDLFSPLWYRVAELKPRLRSHADIHRHHYRGQLWYVLQDHSAGRFYRFTPAAYSLIGIMDGMRNIQEIWQTGLSRLGDDAPTQEELIRLLGQLHSADMLQSDVPPDTAELLKRYDQQQRSWVQNLRNPLAVRIRLVDPERFLNRFLPLVRPFFSWPGLLLWLATVGFAVFQVGVHWAELSQNVTDRILAPQNLFLLWLTFPVVKGLHEFGHGFATKIWGGEIHEMGIMFLVFTPIPYVDASAASAFRYKTRRIMVGAAGIMVELFIAALALFFWLNAESGTARAVAYNIILIAGMSALLFNGNPLLRFDGYYIFSDILEIPNLWQRSTKYVTYLIKRYGFGVRDLEPPPATPAERAWFLGYSLTSLAYRLTIYAGIILFIASKYFIVGMLLAAWAMVNMFVMPAYKGISFIVSNPRLRRKRLRAILASIISLGVAAWFLFFVPLPLSTLAEGVIWTPEQSIVRAGTESFVGQVLAKPQARVRKDEALILCYDPFLPAQIRVLKSRLEELKAVYDSQVTEDRVQAEITKEELETISSQLDRTYERAAELTIRSPTDGVFIIPHVEDLPGRFVRRGEAVAYVLNRTTTTVRMVVPQADIDLVRRRTLAVDVRLVQKIAQTIPAVIQRQVPAASDQLPSKVLGTMGGGRIAVDPRDETGTTVFKKIFQFDLQLPDNIRVDHTGGRVYVRLDHGREPLAQQWYRRLRQLFLRRFHV